MPDGVVMRSTGSRYLVRGVDGSLHNCVARGTLRVKGWNSTNPVAVGDRVAYEPQLSEDQVGAIVELHDRTNYIVRRSVNLSHHKHVIAANLDRMLVLVTVARPRTSFGFIDRMLATAEAYQVPAVVVVNKIDDLDEEEQDALLDLVDTYQQAGYNVLMTAALKGKGMQAVKDLLSGNVTLVAGHSGVGKSTLINAIDADLDLFTLEISESSEKGQHTTTNAEMYELKFGATERPTFIIDTPGIKGFGLVDMNVEDIGDLFPEMFKLKGACRFNNCLHKEEPGCAVRKAVEEGEVAATRYTSYLDMMKGVDEEGPYRVD